MCALQDTTSGRGLSETRNWTLEADSQVPWPLMLHQAPQLVAGPRPGTHDDTQHKISLKNIFEKNFLQSQEQK